ADGADPQVVSQVAAMPKQQLILPVVARRLVTGAYRIEQKRVRQPSRVIESGWFELALPKLAGSGPAASAHQIIVPGSGAGAFARVVANLRKRERPKLANSLGRGGLELAQELNQLILGKLTFENRDLKQRSVAVNAESLVTFIVPAN